MTEQDRIIIVEDINKSIERIRIKDEKLEQIKKLEQLPEVKKYLETLKEKEKIDKLLKSIDSEEKAIQLGFVKGVQSNDYTCNHEIWLYEGSYNCKKNFWNEHSTYSLTEDETDENFLYNKYVCLECRICKQIEKWQEFEKTHLVLKNKSDIDPMKYITMYYQLLYRYSSVDAQKMVIEEFNKNKK